MKKNLLVACFLIGLSTFANNKTDSLKNVLSNSSDKTIKLKTLKALSTDFEETDLDKSIEYGEQALKLAKELQNEIEIAEAHNQIAKVCVDQGSMEKAISNYESAFSIFKKNNRIRESLEAKSMIGGIYSQINQLDKALEIHKSVLEERKKYAKEDVANSLCLIGLVKMYQGNYKEAISYQEEAIKLSEENKNTPDLALAYTNIAITYERMGQWDKSLDFLFKTLKIYAKDEAKLAVTYRAIGVAYSNLGNYKEGNNYYFKGLTMAERIGLDKEISALLNNIGNNFQQLEQFDKAVEIHERALKHNKKIGYEYGTASSLINLGVILLTKKAPEKALPYFKEAYAMSLIFNEPSMISFILNSMGMTYIDLNKIDSAKKVLTQAQEICERIGYTDGQISNYRALSACYSAENNYSISEKYANMMLALAKQFHKLMDIKNAYLSLSEIHTKFNNYKEAYKAYKLYSDYKDSLINKQNLDQLTELQTKYETERKEHQIELLNEKEKVDAAELKKKKIYISSLTVGILLLILLGSLIFYQLRLKQKNASLVALKDKIIEQEKMQVEQQKALHYRLKALRAQMNPHFIFNSLNSIQYYIGKNDIGNSNEFLGKFARLMRKTLENSEYTFISLKDEIDALKEYMELERMRKENKFIYTIHIADHLDIENINIPTLLIQPYVENAILHSIGNESKIININISLNEKDNRLFVFIDDDGIGRKKSSELHNKNHRSFAMDITKARLDLINTLENNIVSTQVIDKTSDIGEALGTRIELSVPNDL
jgi:sensor histidine kinase YesM